MYMISWYDNGCSKVCTVVASEVHTVFCIVSMLEKDKTKYKVTDRLGLIKPKAFNWGDFDYWVSDVDTPLYEM